MQALSPHPQWSDQRERSRVGIQRPQNQRFWCANETRSVSSTPSSFFFSLCAEVLLPLRSNGVVRCSPRLRRCSNVVRNGEAVSSSRESFALSNDDKKRAPPVVAECRIGRSGTLRTAREGKPPAESGAAVSTSDASPDTETGSPILNKRGASSPERGRMG